MHNLWVPRYGEDVCPPSNLENWARHLYISPFLADLLWKRGARSLEQMEFFLNPGLRHLAPLEDWPGLPEAAELIVHAILTHKKIAVWGDYDVDGITATALVVDFLRKHNITATPHIPNRMSEGYGLNAPDLQMLAEDGVELIITVDCGICDYEEIKIARALGMQVVISDHHLPSFPLPEADAICAPTIGECPCPHLSGVGMAFMLMAGVGKILSENGFAKVDIRSLLDLVALGTLADVSNLSGQNRILVKNGLLALAEAKRPGIAALKAICNYAPNANLGAGQVVFTLCPRINAAGRMGKSEVALGLMLTNDRDEAARLAAELDALNTRRRGEEDAIQKEAQNQALEQVVSGRVGLVLYQPHWHMGVIGIVASRVVEEFNRPAIILCNHGDKIKGSGRSIDGFDLHGALIDCSSLFFGFGGHKMAAGLTLAPENLQEFRSRFDALAKEKLGHAPPTIEIKTDGELSVSDSINQTLLKELEMLQPFGLGNAEPIFTSPPLLIRDVRIRPGLFVLDVMDESTGITVKAKLWRPKVELPPHSKGKRLRLAYSPRLDRYNGVASVELRVRDWYLVE